MIHVRVMKQTPLRRISHSCPCSCCGIFLTVTGGELFGNEYSGIGSETDKDGSDDGSDNAYKPYQMPSRLDMFVHLE